MRFFFFKYRLLINTWLIFIYFRVAYLLKNLLER